MTRGIWIMLILCTLPERPVNSELTGNHVCQEEQSYKVNVTKHELQNKTVRRYVWCIQVPPRCSDYIVKTINVTKIEEEERFRFINKCCDGYYQVNGGCSPNSCRFCKYGTCGEDGICNCDLGYWGINCDKECTNESLSKTCPRNCSDCVEGFCDISTGNCTCPLNNARCDVVCTEGRNCVKQCKCDAATVCDPLKAKCVSAVTDYGSPHNDYNNSDSGLIKNVLKPITSYERPDFAAINVTSALPPVTTSSKGNINTENVDHFTTETIKDARMKVVLVASTTTAKTEKDHSYATEISEKVSTENKSNYPIQSSTQEYTSKEFSLPEIISKKNRISNVKEQDTSSIMDTSTKKEKEISALQSSTSSSSTHSVIVDNNVFMTVIGGALFAVLIIMATAVFCVLYKLREKKKKFVTTTKEKEDAKMRDSVSSVSVTTRSIFHTPLPDPPIFENPAFTTQFESSQAKQPGTLETHIICNMNIPNVGSNDQPKSVESTEFFYDHPPSTGSYRATTILEPPIQESVKSSFDPIYDEIPCNQRIVPAATPPPSYTSSEHSTLYMNTK